MFQIGRFSIITRLSIKTLRYYHNENILVPDYIDDETGYRYYRASSVEKAGVIKILREMEFSINEIKEILTGYSEDDEILPFIETQRDKIAEKINQYKNIERNIQSMIEHIRSNEMNENKFKEEIVEKFIDEFIFAGYRFKGIYSDVGDAFRKVAKAAGRFLNGKPMALYYDGEYKAEDADIEGGFPLSGEINSHEVSCRLLKGGKAVTLVHKGPYDNLGISYKKLFSYIEEKKYETILPGREIYLKGPGMIFRGNPKKYVTEIQMLIKG